MSPLMRFSLWCGFSLVVSLAVWIASVRPTANHRAGCCFAVMVGVWILWFFLAAVGLTRGAEPAWWRLTPLRQPDPRLVPTLADIGSQFDPRMMFGSLSGSPDLSDPEHWAHEATHGINSRIRHAAGGSVMGIYVLEGRAIVLPHPRITLAAVAAQVPAPLRFGPFDLYLLQQQRWWQNEPLYVLDEWTAYANGAEMVIEYAERGRAGDEFLPLENAAHFCCFATALLRAVAAHDPTYAQQSELIAFVAWQIERVHTLVERARPFPQLGAARADRLFALFHDHFVSRS